jgi:hypothetical protein
MAIVDAQLVKRGPELAHTEPPHAQFASPLVAQPRGYAVSISAYGAALTRAGLWERFSAAARCWLLAAQPLEPL